ncbi:MAG: amino acid ABC transporter substrate-binding protein [Oscillospiraceae bacterium]|nr:MAG: amino acid ABC transporter substrate-binding protein [Oscillospiraceae bacterium]
MKKFIAAGLALCMALAMVACGGSPSSAASQAGSGVSVPADDSAVIVKMGSIGPITGANAVYGEAVKNGAQIAVDEINASDSAVKFEYNFQDDEGDAETSVNAYNNLKDWGMQVLMGTVTTAPCIAVTSETAADNMFQLTPSASSTDVIVPDNVFQVCFTDPSQGASAADYIAENGLATKIAAIYDSSDAYSSGVYNAFAEEAEAKGLEIVCAEAFTSDNKTDFKTQLQKAQGSGAELVFLPIYYTEAALILTQANQLGYEPTFFGCDGMDGLLDVQNFDTGLAEGLMLMTPFNATSEDELTANFVKTYEEQFGGTPNQFAADAYDAVYAIRDACVKAGVTSDMSVSEIGDALKVAITEVTMDGLTGKNMTWKASGEVSKAPIVVKVENGAYTQL